MRTLTRTQKAYIAGLFDGEGSITFAKGEHGWMRSVQMPNTNFDVLRWIKMHYGGNTYHYKKHQRHHLGKKPICTWYLRDAKGIEKFLISIYPFLFIKIRDAKTMLDNVQGRITYVEAKRRTRKR